MSMIGDDACFACQLKRLNVALRDGSRARAVPVTMSAAKLL